MRTGNRIGSALAVLALQGAALAGQTGDPARGMFGMRDRVGFSVVDAFAWRESGGAGESPVVFVVLSPRTLDRVKLAAALDYRLELERQLDDGAFAELELDAATAAWRSARFALPEGPSCAGCVDPRQLAWARLRVDAGRVRGRIDLGASEAPAGTEPLEVELSLDVAIEPPPSAVALAADGGEPARALESCRAAIRRRDRAAARALCLAPDDERLRLADARLEERFFDSLREASEALSAASLSVAGGRTRGEHAELIVILDGPDGRQSGSVFLLHTPAGWRFDRERLTPMLGD